MIKERSCLWCEKETKTTSEVYHLYKVEIKYGRHPNPKHSINSI